MWQVSRHYRKLDGASRPETPVVADQIHPHIIVPIAKLNVPARQALAFAQAISRQGNVVAVSVAESAGSAGSAGSAEQMRRAWADFSSTVSLEVIESPYRSLIGPLLAYIDACREKYPGDTVVVVLPEYVPIHWWEHLLHNQTALRIKGALLFHPGVVVASVPYHLGAEDEEPVPEPARR